MSDLATIIEGPAASVTATVGVQPNRGNRLTTSTDGSVGLAGISVEGEYIALYNFQSTGAVATVRFTNAQGTQVLQTTAAAMAVGDPVYTAASGLVSNTATSAILLGVCRTAVTSAGGLIVAVLNA